MIIHPDFNGNCLKNKKHTRAQFEHSQLFRMCQDGDLDPQSLGVSCCWFSSQRSPNRYSQKTNTYKQAHLWIRFGWAVSSGWVVLGSPSVRWACRWLGTTQFHMSFGANECSLGGVCALLSVFCFGMAQRKNNVGIVWESLFLKMQGRSPPASGWCAAASTPFKSKAHPSKRPTHMNWGLSGVFFFTFDEFPEQDVLW